MKTYKATVIYASEPEEVEANKVLIYLRNILGYGAAWKFKDALRDMLDPYIFPFIIVGLFIWIASHLQTKWIP
jgi:uncharacterized membrane protein YoaT (DUF817 family)